MLLEEDIDMQVGIVLGSRSQWSTIKYTAELLAHLGVHYEARIITANKSANQLHEYASEAKSRGLEIIIAGPTKKAFLPGIIASKTEIPVLGIQINTESASDYNKGNSIKMFKAGQEGAINAALFAASILANKYPRINKKLIKYRNQNNFETLLEEFQAIPLTIN